MNTQQTRGGLSPRAARSIALLLGGPVVLMADLGTVVTLVARPDPDSFLAYCDLSDIQSLPTWWPTVVLGRAAIAATLVGRTASVDRRWWFAASGPLLLF